MKSVYHQMVLAELEKDDEDLSWEEIARAAINKRYGLKPIGKRLSEVTGRKALELPVRPSQKPCKPRSTVE